MGANTKIEWTDYTFNPWIGCAKVAPGCAHCYAETFAVRTGKDVWGPHVSRVKTSAENWRLPLGWNKAAERAGVRRRVFCASLADVFEDHGLPVVDHRGKQLFMHSVAAGPNTEPVGRQAMISDLRRDLFALIDATPNLDWLLLTKRPENIRCMVPPIVMYRDRDQGPYRHPGMEGIRAIDQSRPNVWLGTSIATQADADANIPALLACRDLAPVMFVSAEPLIEAVDLSTTCINPAQETMGLGGPYISMAHAGIDWLIIGGESGPKARPCNVAWIRSLRDQANEAGVPCFVKQLGRDPVWSDQDAAAGQHMIDIGPKGGDWDQWPEDLRVREFPPAQGWKETPRSLSDANVTIQDAQHRRHTQDLQVLRRACVVGAGPVAVVQPGRQDAPRRDVRGPPTASARPSDGSGGSAATTEGE